MSHLTVTEKEHWKQRISRRIDKAIETIYAEHPGLETRISEAAQSQALESLGIHELHQEVDKIEESEKSLARQKTTKYRQMLSVVNGIPLDEIPAHSSRPYDVTLAIRRRKQLHEEDLLARDPVGQRVLKLRQEKDELLDTVWLATSGSQIKELWRSVSALLNEEPTGLQSEALRIEPVDTESND